MNPIEESRLTGIGASQVSALPLIVRGVPRPACNPWLHESDIYYQALGLGRHTPPSRAMQVGLLQEAVAPELYRLITGRTCERSTELHRLAGHPHILCHPDAWVIEEDPTRRRGVEFKTASPYRMTEWGREADAVPAHYWLQCQDCMLVCGVSAWDLLMMCGTEVRVYELIAEPDVQSAIVAACDSTWQAIEALRAKMSTEAGRVEVATKLAAMAGSRDQDLAFALGQLCQVKRDSHSAPCPVAQLSLAREIMEQTRILRAADANLVQLKNHAMLAMGCGPGWTLDDGSEIQHRRTQYGSCIAVKEVA